MLFHQGNTPCHKSIEMTAKSHKLRFQLHLYSQYSPHLFISRLFVFSEFKRMLAKNKLGESGDVNAESATNFVKTKHIVRLRISLYVIVMVKIYLQKSLTARRDSPKRIKITFNKVIFRPTTKSVVIYFPFKISKPKVIWQPLSRALLSGSGSRNKSFVKFGYLWSF